jgi:hypothetical protein
MLPRERDDGDTMKKPRSDEFADFYKQLDRAELSRQGAEHLTGRADVRARRAGTWAWRVVVALILAVVLGGGAFCLWLMQTAKTSGQAFSAVRDQALQAYSADSE